METPPKYSSGTKGRLKRHSDACKNLIREQAPSPELAEEYLATVDPGEEDRWWQRYLAVEDCLADFQAWLRGEEPSTQPPSVEAKLARLVRGGRLLEGDTWERKIDAAAGRTKRWAETQAAAWNHLNAAAIARQIGEHFLEEITKA